MKRLYLLTISVLTAIFFNACAQTQVDLSPRISDPHIKVENPYLYEWLKLERINYFERKDGLLVVETKFNNLSQFNKNVAYKIDWIDENGFIQKSILSRWIVAEVEQRRSLVIHGIAPSIKIKSFEIRLQVPTSDDKNRKDSYHKEYQN